MIVVLKSHITRLGTTGQEVFLLAPLLACQLAALRACACARRAGSSSRPASSCGRGPGSPGLVRSNDAYESRMLSIILMLSSVAGTTNAASPTIWQ